ncbi:uncharacterized protein METZ01_LOCUS304454, partial [marine metagenome]
VTSSIVWLLPSWQGAEDHLPGYISR